MASSNSVSYTPLDVYKRQTLDWTVPDDLANTPAIVGGKDMDFTYGDCQAEMDMVNKAFIETMIEGDAHGPVSYTHLSGRNAF